MGMHLSNEGLKFLKDLAKHNERNWFEARKHVYEAHVKQPMLEVISGVNDELAKFAPEFVRDPKKIMMRIYRDIRFSKDRRPYKTHVAAWWARQGMEKTSGGGFYLEVGSEAVRIAAGVYMPDKDQLLAIRRMLLDRHEELRHAMKIKDMEPIDAMKMTRGPKGFPNGHPAMDLILQKQWGLRALLPPQAATRANFIREIVRKYRQTAPMVKLLNEPILPQTRKAIF